MMHTHYTCSTCGKPIHISAILTLDMTPRWNAPWIHLFSEDRTGEHHAKPAEIESTDKE